MSGNSTPNENSGNGNSDNSNADNGKTRRLGEKTAGKIVKALGSISQ